VTHDPGTSATPRVADNPDERRYEVWVGDQLAGKAEYRQAGNRLIFFHTEIDDAFAGGGVGSRLAREALDDVRRRGLRVTPKCPFIAAYIRRHPEYRDLVSEPSSRHESDA
jgi:predicted GNAT family acetyltransferase